MNCPNCGKENEANAKFCFECGKPLQSDREMNHDSNDKSVEEKTLSKSDIKYLCLFGAIIIAIIFAIVTVVPKLFDIFQDSVSELNDYLDDFGLGDYLGFDSVDSEYTSNSGDKLPLIVNQIEIKESGMTGYIEITFEIENLTETDYKEANFAVLVWDSEGYPIKLSGMIDYNPDYLKYISVENIRPEDEDEYTYTFEEVDIEYMAVFLSSYEDFDGEEWENPIMDYIEENKGNKLDDMDVWYYGFS